MSASRLAGWLCCLLALPLEAHAAVRTWPGAAPCNASLQACIDASAAADTVLVASNAVIDESLVIGKPFVLRAAEGYRPTLEAGRVINGTVNAAGTWTWQVQGFNLRRGFIQMQVGGGTTANVRLLDNRIAEAQSGAAQLSVFKASAATTTLDYEIARNQLAFAWGTSDGALRAALQVLDGGSGSSSGRIVDNRIDATGSQAFGILVSTSERSHAVGLLGNHVLGGRRGAIYLRQGSGTGAGAGSLDALVASNFVRSDVAGARNSGGIRADAFAGGLSLAVRHNTVIDARYGLDASASPGTTSSGNVVGNLFAHLEFRGLQVSGLGPGFGNASNLFFDSGETAATPGLDPSSLFLDPRLVRVPDDPRLRADSPARDRLGATALQTALDARGLPHTDGDGLRRFKFANTVLKADILDLGAFEAGDGTTLVRVPTAAPGNVAQIDDPLVNGFPNALPQATANWNPDGEGGIYNDHPVSLRYLPTFARWQLRQEDLDAFTPGARFSLFAPGAGAGRFLHLNTAANTSGGLSELDDPSLNNRESNVVLATRNPGTGPVVADLPGPLAVNFFSGVWSVVRLGGGSIPVSGGFNVYTQSPSINAFRMRTSAGNIVGNVAYIDHPLLNGNRCARFQVGQGTDFGVSNPRYIGVFYAPSRGQWAVFNQDFGSAMPVGTEFHVVVDPSAVSCVDGLFADGFESP